MKFLYFGDRHNRVTSPESRIDNFQNSMDLKDQEIISLANKYKVNAYLQPGDFWETPNPPLDYASNVIKKWFNVDVFEILQKMTAKDNIEKELALKDLMAKVLSGEIKDIDLLSNEINKHVSEEKLKSDTTFEKLKGFIPMVGVVGNHELFGNNINTLPKTMIGFMEKLGLIRFATKENPYIVETEDGLKIAITGTHYHLDIDDEKYLSDYIVEEKLGDYHIHIVHGMLSDKSMGKIIRHTIIDQIRSTKADLTITGHDHIGFPLTQIDGKLFVNTGAIPRLSNDVKEIKRKPKVLIIDITKSNGLQVKEIYLKSAMDGETILDRKKIVARKEKENKLEEFKKAVREAGLVNTTDINEIIRDLAENKNLPLELRDDVVNRISDKKKDMDSCLEGILSEAYIDKIVLENFQSHKYTEIDVSRGFNIFVGESRQGKSSMLRAIDWVYENKPLGKAFIRKGADYSKVTLTLSNGYVISRYVEAKKTGKNGYYIYDPNTGETNFHNTKILPEVQKILGFNLFSVDDKDLQFNLNFLKQGKGWFMIGDEYSAPTKAKIIGAIYGTQYADAVIRDMDTEEKRLNDKTKLSFEEYQKIENSINQYSYLPEIKTSIEDMDKLIKDIEELTERKNKIEEILEKRDLLTKNIEECEQDLSQLANLNKIKELFQISQKELERHQRMVDTIEKREESFKMFRNASYVSNLLSDTDKWKKLLNDTNLLMTHKTSIESNLDKRDELLKNIQEETQIITQTEQLVKAKNIFSSLKTEHEKLNSINTLINSRDILISDLKVQEDIIKQTEFIHQAQALVNKIKEYELTQKELKAKMERAEIVTKEKEELLKGIKGCNIIMEYTKYNEQAKTTLEEVKQLIDKKDKIVTAIVSRENIAKDIDTANNAIKIYTEQIQQDITKYKVILGKAGKCPVCHGTIDKATINRIVEDFSK